jgi:tetratricopeptide (TPR) repeat protein
METPSPSRRQRDLDAVLRIMRYQTWALVTVISVLIVGAPSAFILQAVGAKTVGLAIFVLAGCVAAGGTAAWITAEVLSGRAIKRFGLHDVVDLMDKKRWDEAIAKLEALQSSADPDTADEARDLLGDAYAATGRNAESEAMIRRSIDRRGESDETLGEQLACLGVVVRRQGRIEEAEEIMARALNLVRNHDPEATVFILRNVAYLYWVNGQEDRAREIYDEMPECDPDQLEFLTNTLKPFEEPPLPA